MLVTTPSPLVIVGGFLGGAGSLVWGNFEEHSNHACRLDGKEERKIIFASVGPVSSLHDRACELFYSLMGGVVDYGEKHSERYNHGRYGREHLIGLYPEWSRNNPLHFLGHSLGGPTILKLQWLIETGFYGRNHHPDMILSVNAISAPFLGTQAVYLLGEHPERAPAVRPLSFGSAITKIAHTLSYFAPILPDALDMHTESRNLSFDKSSPFEFLKQLWHSDWAESEDTTPFDMTFQAAGRREAALEGKVNPRTFYRSYAACMTKRTTDDTEMHRPDLRDLLTVSPMYLISQAMGSFDFSVVKPEPSFLSNTNVDNSESNDPPGGSPGLNGSDGEAYWANDGVVPLFSQWHPLQCSDTKCRHLVLPLDESAGTDSRPQAQNPAEEEARPESGIWYVHHVDDASHVSIVPFWLGTERQKLFWKDIGRWLWEVDAARFAEQADGQRLRRQ